MPTPSPPTASGSASASASASRSRDAPPTPGSTISAPHEGDGGNVNAQPKGEIEVVFIDALDSKYECVVCEQVLRFPVQFEECGHRCCSNCLSDLIAALGHCPVDQVAVSREKIYVDRAFQREIDSLGVKCSFCTNGCQWTGMLRELVQHFGTCAHVIVPCPLNCGLEFEKRYQDQHLVNDCAKRDVNCKHCNRTMQADQELPHYDTDCPRFPVSCPNNCKKKAVPREELESHLETQCTRQDYPCPFNDYGCEFTSIKRKIKEHCRSPEEMERHLFMLCETMKTIKTKTTRHDAGLEDHGTRVAKLEQRVQNIEKIYGAQLVWRIEGFKQRFDDAKSGKKPTLFSPPFLTSRHGYKMALSICPFGDGKSKGKFMSLFVCICRGDYDPLLQWPFANKITFTLVDQCEDPMQQRNVCYHIRPNVCKENEPFLGRPRGERNASFGAQKFVELQVLNTLDYIRDDAIYIRVEIEMDNMLLI